MALHRTISLSFIGFLWLALGGCYHMRAEMEPIAPLVFTLSQSPAEAAAKIRATLENGHRLRILQERNQGAMMITAPWHFATDTGFGQPAGGRRYYSQLQIEMVPVKSGTRVTLSPYRYEIRSTYAYGDNGQVETLNKHYPYEEYPGMFDNTLLKQALGDMAKAILDACNE